MTGYDFDVVICCKGVDGSCRWFKNGKLHRDDGQPAELLPNGVRRWYRNGKLYRDGNKPVETFDARKEY